MSSDDTIYKFEDGYILLEDLESWYAHGFITPEDRIKIFGTDGKKVSYKISYLIRQLGEKFPFRRVSELSNTDQLGKATSISDISKISSSDETAVQTEMKQSVDLLEARNSEPESSNQTTSSMHNEEDPETSDAPKEIVNSSTTLESNQNDSEKAASNTKNTRIVPYLSNKVDGTIDYVFADYPLYNNKNEEEGDKITGQEVVEEIEKLEMLLPLEPWCKEIDEYFFFVNRRDSKIGMRDRVVICRFCQIIPFSPAAFFTHLYGENHVARLSKCEISRSSFQFWTDHIEICMRIVESRQRRIDSLPLFLSYEGDKDRMDPDEIKEIVDLFSKITDVEFMNEQCYVAILFRTRNPPKYCQTCQCKMPYIMYQYAKHILSEKHLISLQYVSQKDIDFWIDALKIPMVLPEKANEEVTTNKPIFDVIPLFSSDQNGDKQILEASEIRLLSKLVNNLNSQFDDTYLSNFYSLLSLPDYCELCQKQLGFNKNIRQIPFTKHILSEQHLKSLRGVHSTHYNFWVNILSLEVTAKKMYTADKIRVLSYKNTRPVPLIDFKLDSVLHEVKTREEKVEELYSIYESIKKEFGDFKQLSNPGNRLIPEEIVCYACETPKGRFKNYDDLLAHIFSELHVDYLLQCGFSEKAFLWWEKSLRLSPNSMYLEEVDDCSIEKPESSDSLETQKIPVVVDALEFSHHASDNCEDETDSDEEEKKENGIAPNYSRIPLLDKPPPNAEMITKFQFTFNYLQNIHKKLMDCFDEQKERAKAMRILSCHCTFCDENLQPISFGNKLWLFNHISSRRHWEKMNYTAPIADVEYWKNWANCIFSNTIERNLPRVPMLDPFPSSSQTVTKERMDEALDEFRGLLSAKTNIRQVGMRETVFWTCAYCSDLIETVYLFDKLDVIDHIFKETHREKMDHKTTETDLKYWMKWLTDLKEKAEKEEQKARECCAVLYGETSSKPKNDPFVPLLDHHLPFKSHMRTWRYKVLYNRIREYLKLLKPCAETEEAVNCVCYHCPGEPKMTTVWELMHHVFDGLHDQNIKYLGRTVDFGYYERIMQKMFKANPLPRVLPEKYFSKPPPPRAVLSYKLTASKLPLFTRNYFKPKKGTICDGPTNVQIDFIKRMGVKDQEKIVPFYDKPTKCAPCSLDMSNYSIQETVEHVFSVKHLAQFQSAVVIYVEEIDWWMEKLRNDSNIVPPPPPFPSFECQLGGLKPGIKNPFAPVFDNFTEEQVELISNLDGEKVKKTCRNSFAEVCRMHIL